MLTWQQGLALQAGLTSNSLESGGIKDWVVRIFPLSTNSQHCGYGSVNDW